LFFQLSGPRPVSSTLGLQEEIMSYFVTVTFDLNYANMSPHGNNVYSKITDALEQIDYSTVVSGKKKRTLQLPSNIYVAEFDDDFEHQTEVVEFVKLELKKIFTLYSVSGKYFVSAGKNWAWKAGSF
jgi:hypothetical protein